MLVYFIGCYVGDVFFGFDDKVVVVDGVAYW